ncbi:MAG: DUF3014 domain-containing protein [Vicinamibacterales bacterium]
MLDDQPLRSTSDTPEPPPENGGRRLFIVAAVVGLLAGGLGAWWWISGRPAPPAQQAAEAPATGTEEPLPAAEPAAEPLPPLMEMDPYLRTLLGALSTRPEMAAWLATNDLIRQMASGVSRIARGESPARDLAVLAPQGTFAVQGRGRNATLDPSSYRRYDGLADTIAALDPEAVARAYRQIYPRLDEAYRGLGYPEGDVSAVVSRAFDVLLATPVVEDPVRLEPGPGPRWVLADPKLEGLEPAQKQLLRMGPRNVEKIQTKLHAIRGAIEGR